MSELTKVLKDFGFSERFLEKISEERPAFEFEPQEVVQYPQYTESENIVINSNLSSASTNIILSDTDLDKPLE